MILFLSLVSLSVLLYTIFFLSPEKIGHVWLFLVALAIFLTSTLTSLLHLIKRKINPEKKPRLRRALAFSFTASLLPILYLCLKVLGAANQTNLFLLTLIVILSLFYILRNGQ